MKTRRPRRGAFGMCIVAMVATMISCTKSADPVARDFERYMAQMATILDIESEAIQANTEVTKDPNANDASYARVLRATVLPKLDEFYRELTRLHPMTNEIQGLHQTYLTRTKILIAGFKTLEKAATTGSSALANEGNMQLKESKLYFEKWSKRLAELSKRYPLQKERT